MERKVDRQALKDLRRQRADVIQKAKETIKTQNQIFTAVRDEIKTGGRTIPEIARAAGLPAAVVLQVVATLRKYGMVTEGEKDGDYFRYQLSG